MHFPTILTAAAVAFPSVITAHGEAGPKIFGRRTVAELKARNVFGNNHARAVGPEADHASPPAVKRKENEKRQNTDGQCGAGFGSCAAGICCSQAGWCGTTVDYCYSPGCQYQYGPGCPENQTPAGTNTSSVARTALGSIAYGGAGIYDCVTPGTVAITYDDGPYIYTTQVLDVLANYSAKATFFITGNNLGKGEIDIASNGYVPIIQRMHTDGHQIASHTWTHLDLSAISSLDRKNQMWKNEMALRNILGFFPTYMRPPYSSCTASSGCEADMETLGYHVTYFDVDTDDYEQDSTTLIQNSKNWFTGNITAGGATAANSDWLVIGHDIHYQTAYNLTDYMLSTLTSLGYKAVTVGECLGDPAANWYRTASGAPSSTSTSAASSSTPSSATSSAAPAATAVSTDATCGGTTSFTCQGSTFGNCCSINGWCGSTSDYCGTGCQAGFGTCGVGSAVSSTTATASAPAASSTVVSTDGTCGGTNAYTCQGSTFGNCCSQYGWCGSTSAYCATTSGCQAGFGTCS